MSGHFLGGRLFFAGTFGYSSPWLYRWIFAIVCGVLLASGDVIGGVVTGVVAIVLQLAWWRWGAEHTKRSRGAVF
jgi:hypothetical protein